MAHTFHSTHPNSYGSNSPALARHIPNYLYLRGKALMQAHLLLNDYIVEDEAGNALVAQKIIADYVAAAHAGLVTPQLMPTTPTTSAPDSAQTPPPAQAKEPEKPAGLLYSDAVERYVAAKIQDRSWKQHNVGDIRNRLQYFIDIIGNKAIQNITREDMRTFIEILQKLPPNRKKLKIYAGKTTAEIISMQPQKTLGVTTVNTIVEAVCSMLNWFDQEGELPQKIRQKVCKLRMTAIPANCVNHLLCQNWKKFLPTPNLR